MTTPKGRIDPDEAADILHQLLEAQKLVAVEATEANRLKAEELAVERDKVNNRSRELDILAQQVAIEKERLNRADARLQEVIQRYVIAENKLITTDDAFVLDKELFASFLVSKNPIPQAQYPLKMGRCWLNVILGPKVAVKKLGYIIAAFELGGVS